MSALIAELAEAAAAEKGIVFDGAIEDRLCAYSRAVAHFPTAVKEVKNVNISFRYSNYYDSKSLTIIMDLCLQFKWRNGWFYSLTEKAIAQGKQDPCPLHTAWLKELKIV